MCLDASGSIFFLVSYYGDDQMTTSGELDEARKLDRELEKELAPLMEREAEERERTHAMRMEKQAHAAAAPPRTSFATALFAGVAIGVGLATYVAERAASL